MVHANTNAIITFKDPIKPAHHRKEPAMDYETGAPVLYDNHIYYARLWPLTPTIV